MKIPLYHPFKVPIILSTLETHQQLLIKKTINHQVNEPSKHTSDNSSEHRSGTSSIAVNPVLQTNPFRSSLSRKEIHAIIHDGIKRGIEIRKSLEEENSESSELPHKESTQQSSKKTYNSILMTKAIGKYIQESSYSDTTTTSSPNSDKIYIIVIKKIKRSLQIHCFLKNLSTKS